jgi:hypothetical protein
MLVESVKAGKAAKDERRIPCLYDSHSANPDGKIPGKITTSTSYCHASFDRRHYYQSQTINSSFISPYI